MVSPDKGKKTKPEDFHREQKDKNPEGGITEPKGVFLSRDRVKETAERREGKNRPRERVHPKKKRKQARGGKTVKKKSNKGKKGGKTRISSEKKTFCPGGERKGNRKREKGVVKKTKRVRRKKCKKKASMLASKNPNHSQKKKNNQTTASTHGSWEKMEVHSWGRADRKKFAVKDQGR